MILGSVSFIKSDIVDSSLRLIRSNVELEDLFNPVEQQGLIGGYYLHPDLPLQSFDLYYADLNNDIIVLHSGYVYNKSDFLHLNEGKNLITDPEFIARLFLKEGPRFVERLIGDFAFLIYRPRKGESFLFRDHIGIRPLAWTIQNNTIYFSTEILGLCRTFSKGNNTDADYLLGYFKYIDYRKTPNKDVFKLLPGHYLKYTEKGVEIFQYWHPEKIKIDRKLQYDQMLSDLRSIVNDSVKIRCDNRFVAGAHVSGGIDSGLISALARRNFKHQEKFYGFSWSPEYFSSASVNHDERDLVLKLCNAIETEPLFSTIDSEEFIRIISSLHRNNGFFSEDIMSEQVVKTSTNLILSGWGGDEFISTGDRGIELDLIKRFKLQLFFKRNPLKRPVKFLKYLLSFVIFPAIGILDRKNKKSFNDNTRYLKKPYNQSDKKAVSDFYFHSSRQQLHLRMLKFYHLQYRCEAWTTMGFRKGIEYRYPLLDKRIIEYMLKVPSELLCKTDYFRPVLREIGKGILPEEVRLNWDKSDPVYWSWMDELFRESAIKHMNEVSIWKSNPDLHFVDFDLLETEIQRFRNNLLKINHKILFRSMVYLKAIHDFTIRYKSTKS